MTDSPDAIRSDIERTRRELGSDVDALADKVNPSKIMDRQADKVRNAFSSVRERVMGTAEDVGDSRSSAGSDAAEGVRGVAHDVKAKVEGSPLAVGLIAFGVGLVAASLIPASAKEKELAATAKEQAQPLMAEVAGAAKEVASDLKEPAQDAATAVKERATEAVEHVKHEASDAAHDVQDRAQEARDNLAGG